MSLERYHEPGGGRAVSCAYIKVFYGNKSLVHSQLHTVVGGKSSVPVTAFQRAGVQALRTPRKITGGLQLH